MVFQDPVTSPNPQAPVAALNRRRAADRAVTPLAVAGHSLPGYRPGILMIWLLAVEPRWLPSSGHGTATRMALPVATLAVHPGAGVARHVRGQVPDARTTGRADASQGPGIPPPQTSLGLLPNDPRGSMTLCRWLPVVPGVAIFGTARSVSLPGDARVNRAALILGDRAAGPTGGRRGAFPPSPSPRRRAGRLEDRAGLG